MRDRVRLAIGQLDKSLSRQQSFHHHTKGYAMRPLICLLLSLASVCHADEHSDKFVSQVRERIAAVEKDRSELEKQLKAMSAGRINRNIDEPFVALEVRGAARYVWRDREVKDKHVAEVKQQLESLADPSRIISSLPLATQWAVGMIGNMIDSETGTTFVRIGETGLQSVQVTAYRCIAFQVLDEKLVLVKHESQTTGAVGEPAKVRSEIFLLKTPTSEIADGQQIAVAGVHKVTGTHQYKSAAGVRTVFVLEPFDADQLIKQAKQAK